MTHPELRILIVEDELIIAHHIAEVLHSKGFENTRIVKTLDAARHEVEEFKPQLILSDIMLGSAADGIELGRLNFEKYHIPFIYITSHGSLEMIREASKTMPNAYLVKPFKTPDLLAAIELAIQSIQGSQPQTAGSDQVWIKDGTSLLQMNKHDILYLKAEENYTAIHTFGNKHKLVRQFLNEVHNMLPDNSFIRIHKSYVVNLKHVTKVKSGTLLMGDLEVPLGRTFKSDLMKALG